MKYLLLLDKDYFYYYLFMHPEVMEDQTIRKRVLNNYLLNNQFRRETRDYYHDRYSPTFVNNLRRLTYDNTYYNFNKYNRSHNRHNDISINLNQDQLKRDLWQELQERYQQIHEENIREIEEKPPDEDKPLPTDTTSDTQQKIDDILKKHREKMDKRHRKVQKDAENRVKVLTERMNTKNGSRFKRWLSSHAHNTRHDCNDLQIVPIDKKFIIVNDKTGQLDLLDYPGDPTGSPANVYNCLCDVDFDEDIIKDGINLDEYDYQQIKQAQKDKSQEIKFNIFQEKYIKGVIKNNTKTQEQLKKQYLQEHGKLPSYLKNNNEYMFQEYKGKVHLIHIFGNKNDLIVNTITGKSKNKLYNRISESFKSTLSDYENLKKEHPEIYESVKFYSGDGFTFFNGWKREGKQFLENKLNLNSKDINEMIKKYQKHEANLKKLLVPLEEDLVLYRGQENIYHSVIEGTTAKWDSYTSTSMGIGPAFSYSNGNYIYEIHIPKGKKIIPMLQQGENSKEIEMVLPPDTKFEVGKIRVQKGMKILPINIL